MKVLFIKDHSFLATALRLALITRGYELIEINDKVAPSKALETYMPNVVIADISNQNGYNYVEEASGKGVPVLVISKNCCEDDLQKAFDKGAMDYISFPTSLNELSLRLNLLLQKK